MFRDLLAWNRGISAMHGFTLSVGAPLFLLRRVFQYCTLGLKIKSGKLKTDDNGKRLLPQGVEKLPRQKTAEPLKYGEMASKPDHFFTLTNVWRECGV